MKNCIRIGFICFLTALVGCEFKLKTDHSDTPPPSRHIITDSDSVPIGVEIYRNSYGSPISKVDYQINTIDTFQFSYLVKYFSSSGELIRIEGIKNDSTEVVLLSEKRSLINNIDLGKLLVAEYCNSCHKMTVQGLAPALKALVISEAALIQSLKSGHHQLGDSKLIWENKTSLDFIPKEHLMAIATYINEWNPVVAD